MDAVLQLVRVIDAILFQSFKSIFFSPDDIVIHLFLIK